MNSSSEPSPSAAPEKVDGAALAACVILGLTFLIGAPGNLLVIWVILRYIKQRFHTVVLLLHLAVADLLTLVTLPLWIYSLQHAWVFGETLCKLVVYVVMVCMFSSIFLITLLSVERFLAVCHPFLMMRWKHKRNMNRCLLFLWLFALLLGVPAFITQTLDERDGAEHCLTKELTSDTLTITFLCLETSLGFVLPVATLSVCYCLVDAQLKKMSFPSKQKSKVLIHNVVVVFILCWLPHHAVNVTDVVCRVFFDTQHECVPRTLVLSTGALVFISSSVNPVLYTLLARNTTERLGESRLVRLFQEVATNTNKLWENAMQHQNNRRAASTPTETMLSSPS